MTPAYSATACDTEAASTVSGRVEVGQLGRKAFCLRAICSRPGDVLCIEGDEGGNQSTGLFSALCALTGVGLQKAAQMSNTGRAANQRLRIGVELELTWGGHESAVGNVML